MPRDVQELENALGHRLGMQDELFVVDGHARLGTNSDALGVHALDDVVPTRETVAVACQIETGYGYFARDYRVYGGTSVTDHEYVLGVGKHGLHVVGVAQDERIFVT